MNKKQLFNQIIAKNYHWLKFKVSKFMRFDFVNDAVHSSICYFLSYHINYFNMEFYDNEKELKKGARNYFLKRFFWYFRSFYGEKFKIFSYGDKFEVDDSTLIDQFCYSHIGNKIHDRCSEKLQKMKLKLAYTIDVEDRVYLEQFKNFINHYQLGITVKNKIFDYLSSNDKTIFGTNQNYYLILLNKIRKDFDRDICIN